MDNQSHPELPETASTTAIELGELREQPISNTEDAEDTEDTRDSESLSQLNTHEESARPRSQSVDDQSYHQGIYWRSPITMVTLFLFGVFMCLGHHLYYNSLVGQVVGDVNDQQRSLRYGNLFAYFVHTSFVASVGFAYIQVSWKALKSREFSIEGIDAIVGAMHNTLSLFNREILWKMKVGWLLALIACYLPIPALITPATLFVNPSYSTQAIIAPVRRLNISGENQPGRFTYSVPVNGPGSNDTASQIFLGPRTIISRLSVATATLGEILPIIPPFANASYQIKFYGPMVNCTDANSSVATTIDKMVQGEMSTLQNGAREVQNFYYAFVPELNGPDVEPILSNRFQQPANASNQLWMTFQRYVYNSTGAKVPTPRHLVCQLYNASYDLSLSFVETNQSITTNSLQILNAVDYPQIDPETPSDLVQHAYSAYMWAFTDQLVGSMGIYNDTSLANNSISSSSGITQFGEIKTQIEHTSLLGSQDLDYYFDSHHAILENTSIWTAYTNSDQRQEDIRLAQNQTLDVLIPELAFNTTVSFMTSVLLSPSVNTTVNTTTSVNLYAYHSHNLWIAYGLAIFFALFANVLGGLAYYHNGVCYDMSFSSILSSTRDSGIAKLFHHQVLGKLPLPRNIRRAHLRFGRMKEGEGGLGFHVVAR